MAGLLDTNMLTQVGFIVRNLEESREKFAHFFGVALPPICDGGEYAVTGTTVNGMPAPKANCRMAFFAAGGSVQIELIEPNGEKSTWQDFLDEHGEGIHHIAFNIKGMGQKLIACENAGMQCLQHGKYGNAGGEYAYVDATKDLKCILELLENYEA